MIFGVYSHDFVNDFAIRPEARCPKRITQDGNMVIAARSVVLRANHSPQEWFAPERSKEISGDQCALNLFRLAFTGQVENPRTIRRDVFDRRSSALQVEKAREGGICV